MKGKFKDGLERMLNSVRNKAKVGILLITMGQNLCGFNNTCLANEEIFGKLTMMNWIDDYDSDKGTHFITHSQGSEEGQDTFDRSYGNTPFPPSGKITKIVSKVPLIPGSELRVDVRPLNSLTSVDLELAIHTQWGGPLTFLDMRNELRCSLPLVDTPPYFADFGSKPITYWERDATDPNMFYLIANVRKEIAQNGGIIPLPPLEGTYGSEEPYLHAQIRFNDHFVHLNDDDIVDLKDYAIFANAFGRTGITDTNRAEPNDLGAWADYDLDGDVDLQDLSIFTDYYLTSRTYHLEDGWIIK